MLSSPGWAALQRHVNVKQLAEQKAIIQGRCEDFEDYKSRVAYTDGMEFVTSLPAKMIDQAEMLVRQMIQRQEEE